MGLKRAPRMRWTRGVRREKTRGLKAAQLNLTDARAKSSIVCRILFTRSGENVSTNLSALGSEIPRLRSSPKTFARCACSCEYSRERPLRCGTISPFSSHHWRQRALTPATLITSLVFNMLAGSSFLNHDATAKTFPLQRVASVTATLWWSARTPWSAFPCWQAVGRAGE